MDKYFKNLLTKNGNYSKIIIKEGGNKMKKMVNGFKGTAKDFRKWLEEQRRESK